MLGGAEGGAILAAAVSGPLITGFAGLGGVFLGALITIWNERHVRREQAFRELEAAALHVLARAKKVRRAEQLSDVWAWKKVRSDEIYYLGGDLDRYLAAIAGVGMHTEDSQRHWDIYESAMTIVIGQDTSNLAQVIDELERVRKELKAKLREETRP
jgi:hypothetical protein